MKSFKDWLNESSPQSRKKMGILMGQYPPCTDAEMLGSKSTFPWFNDYKNGTAFKNPKKSEDKLKKLGL
jgi:hypothetical protein